MLKKNRTKTSSIWTIIMQLFYFGKRKDKAEHKGMGTCGRTEMCQDSDNADQKVKWFLKVHKTY